MRSINGDEKIYKKVVPMILKIRESSEKKRREIKPIISNCSKLIL